MSEDPDGGDVAPVRDPGLATERTDIAWSRSALAMVACAAAVLRRVPSMPRGASVGLVLTVGLMFAGASFLVRRRLTALEGAPAIAVSRYRLRNAAVLTTTTGVVCLFVMLLTIG